MRRLWLAFFCISVFVLGGALFPAWAQDASAGGITVSAPWSRATPPSANTGALYATIHNPGDAPDRLIGIESDVAARGEVHEMTMEGGVMRMRPLKDGITIAPGETVSLAPGGLHGMLMGLKAPLKPGDSFNATAIFETAGRIAVTVSVVPMGAPAPGGGMQMQMQHGDGKP